MIFLRTIICCAVLLFMAACSEPAGETVEDPQPPLVAVERANPASTVSGSGPASPAAASQSKLSLKSLT